MVTNPRSSCTKSTATITWKSPAFSDIRQEIQSHSYTKPAGACENYSAMMEEFLRAQSSNRPAACRPRLEHMRSQQTSRRGSIILQRQPEGRRAAVRTVPNLYSGLFFWAPLALMLLCWTWLFRTIYEALNK